jgi:NitT/TauT family transport system substrate-binding protein
MKSVHAAAAVAIAAGALLAVPHMKAEAQELTRIHLMQAANRGISSYPIIVAEALGYFKQEGVDFDLLPVQEKVPFVAFLSNGEAEVVKLDSTAVFSAVDAGVRVKVVYEVFQNSPDGIQVPADSAAKTLKD